MATKKQSGIHFEVIQPSEDETSFHWVLYKGKQRIVSEGFADSAAEAKLQIEEFKLSKGLK